MEHQSRTGHGRTWRTTRVNIHRFLRFVSPVYGPLFSVGYQNLYWTTSYVSRENQRYVLDVTLPIYLFILGPIKGLGFLSLCCQGPCSVSVRYLLSSSWVKDRACTQERTKWSRKVKREIWKKEEEWNKKERRIGENKRKNRRKRNRMKRAC